METVLIIRLNLFAIDETLLRLRSAVEPPEFFHALDHIKVRAVEVLTVPDSASDATKHDLSERKLAESQGVSKLDVDTEDNEVHTTIHQILNNFVDLAAHF